jgi:hypothetical protein
MRAKPKSPNNLRTEFAKAASRVSFGKGRSQITLTKTYRLLIPFHLALGVMTFTPSSMYSCDLRSWFRSMIERGASDTA